MTESTSKTPVWPFVVVGLVAAAAGAWWFQKAPTTPSSPNTAATTASAASALVAPASQAAPGASAALDPNGVPADFWQQSFDTPDGKSIQLAQYRGKPLVINFWASWCPPCVKEMPDIDRFHQDMKAQGWQVLGLAIDGPTPVKEFLAKVPVRFDIGLAGFGGTELSQALGNTAGGLPFTVVIGADGRILHRKVGGTHYDELKSWTRPQ